MGDMDPLTSPTTPSSGGVAVSTTSRSRSAHSTSWPWLSPRALVTTLASLSLLGALLHAYAGTSKSEPTSLPPDARAGTAGACRMTYSSPSYLHLKGFGREYSRLAEGPWALYLYREAGWDPDPMPLRPGVDAESEEEGHLDRSLRLTGTPVLFVPGNAGSFRQVRSLASVATRTFFSLPGVKRKMPQGSTNPGSRQLDFFALDFNDDFSAFHGQTLLDQAEYLADSIRYILSLYRSAPILPDPTSVIVFAHSMGGIVARAAILHPHFQKDSISTLVTFAAPHTVPPASVDRAVDQVYSSLALPSDALPPVTISISGGQSDITISSESTILPLDPKDGFTVFTTAIPAIRTPVDHLAILWCEQMMEIIARSVLSIVDVRNPEGVVGRSERLVRMERELLGGWESSSSKEELGKGRSGVWSKGRVEKMDVGQRLVIRGEAKEWANAEGLDTKVVVMPVPPPRTYGSVKTFTVISERSIGRKKDEIEVYACRSPASKGHEESCVSLSPSRTAFLPRETHEAEPMGIVSVNVEDLVKQGSDCVVVVAKKHAGWVVAEFGDREKRTKTVDRSALQLLMGGYRLDAFPSSASLVSELWLPALDSSLLTLKFNALRSSCQESKALFPPTMRQYSTLVHESIFFPSVRTASLHTHASGPFQHHRPSDGTHLQLYLDPSCGGADLDIEISVDVWKTLGNLVVRYRMAAVAFPFSIVLLVLAMQLREYNAGYLFLPFGSAFSLMCKRVLTPLLLSLFGTSLLQSITLAAYPDGAASSWIADVLLGNRSAFWAFLAPLIVFACLAGVVLEYILLQAIVSGAVWALKLPAVKAKFAVPEARDTLPAQRVLSMGLLLLIVLFFAPYQFAFLVIFLVHLFSTIRALLIAQDPTGNNDKRAWDRYHYSFAILLLMMSLLPLSALILVVWVRNLAVGWLAPFSSDHNVLNIVGFLVNVEALHSGKMLQRARGRLASFASVALPVAFASYSFLYGIRFAHSIFPFANALALFLAANNSDALVGRAYEVVVGKRRKSVFAIQVPIPKTQQAAKASAVRTS